MSDETTKAPAGESVKTDPANGEDTKWPDEAKILPDPYLGKDATNAKP